MNDKTCEQASRFAIALQSACDASETPMFGVLEVIEIVNRTPELFNTLWRHLREHNGHAPMFYAPDELYTWIVEGPAIAATAAE